VEVAVLADTHAPRRWRSCPPPVAGHLRGADLMLHAGGRGHQPPLGRAAMLATVPPAVAWPPLSPWW